jgi:arginine-tRNA-protein transferase
MISLASFVTPPGPCSYLPDRVSQTQYEIVFEAKREDYVRLLNSGWRRFGRAYFRPRCPACTSCLSLRVPADRFTPDRSQRRNRRENTGRVRLHIGAPEVTAEKLELYDRYHAFQAANVGWREHDAKAADEYAESFTENPFPSEEWQYFLDDRLVGVGYVDALSAGLSAIYYFHDPDLRGRGLGTWNVLSVIAEAARRGLEYVYLGYFVKGCRSLEYKGRYRPAEAYDLAAGAWRPFDDPR